MRQRPNTRCDWYIDGQLKSVADYLEFSPVQPGTYEIKLIVTAYGESQATVVFSDVSRQRIAGYVHL